MKDKILEQYPDSKVEPLYRRTYIITKDNQYFSCSNDSSTCYYHGVLGSGKVDVRGTKVTPQLLKEYGSMGER